MLTLDRAEESKIVETERDAYAVVALQDGVNTPKFTSHAPLLNSLSWLVSVLSFL